ncbi:unnamed protein product [Hermetia illucens]|uniref:Uncharacterized protein n=1 Tax=Hermetia illucens TaxID=343691 RepID=A0A7R8UZ03_HERIL|nr:unnamed protein product [Hermetia illucens]
MSQALLLSFFGRSYAPIKNNKGQFDGGLSGVIVSPATEASGEKWSASCCLPKKCLETFRRSSRISSVEGLGDEGMAGEQERVGASPTIRKQSDFDFSKLDIEDRIVLEGFDMTGTNLVNLPVNCLLVGANGGNKLGFSSSKEEERLKSLLGYESTKAVRSYFRFAKNLGEGFQRQKRRLVGKFNKKEVKSAENTLDTSDTENPYAGSSSLTDYSPAIALEWEEPKTPPMDNIQNQTKLEDTPPAPIALMMPPKSAPTPPVSEDKNWILMQIFQGGKLIAVRPMDDKMLTSLDLSDLFGPEEYFSAKIMKAPLKTSLREILDLHGPNSVKYIGKHQELGQLIIGQNDEILGIIPKEPTVKPN